MTAARIRMRLANRAAAGMPRTRLAIGQHCEDRNSDGRSERINFSRGSSGKRRWRGGRLQPMNSEEERAARARVREALGVVEPHPGLRSRVIASTPAEGRGGGASRRPWVAGGIAVLLALTVVAGRVVFSRGGPPPPPPRPPPLR